MRHFVLARCRNVERTVNLTCVVRVELLGDNRRGCLDFIVNILRNADINLDSSGVVDCDCRGVGDVESLDIIKSVSL